MLSLICIGRTCAPSPRTTASRWCTARSGGCCTCPFGLTAVPFSSGLPPAWRQADGSPGTRSRSITASPPLTTAARPQAHASRVIRYAVGDNRVDLVRDDGATSSLWWATKNEWLGLTEVAGLEVEALYGGFAEEPFIGPRVRVRHQETPAAERFAKPAHYRVTEIQAAPVHASSR